MADWKTAQVIGTTVVGAPNTGLDAAQVIGTTVVGAPNTVLNVAQVVGAVACYTGTNLKVAQLCCAVCVRRDPGVVIVACC